MAVIYTSNPVHEYDFSWTIEHLTHTPDVLQGPRFSPVPGLIEDICFEIRYSSQFSHFIGVCSVMEYTMKLFLVDMYGNAIDRFIYVSSSISFRRTNHQSLKNANNSSTEFLGSVLLLEYARKLKKSLCKFEYIKLMSLLEDKLVIKGKLTFSGCVHRIAPSVSSLLAKDRSETFAELSKDLKAIYESGLSSDVTFSVGEKTLRAHKTILVSRSPVFAKMFDSDMLENRSSNIVIEDSDFDVFNCFLMFLYTGILEDKKWDTVLALYSLGHKYQVKSLHEMCSGILGDSLTIDSACSVLALSDLHLDKELKSVASGFIQRHILQIAGTTEWAELVSTKPHLVKEVMS